MDNKDYVVYSINNEVIFVPQQNQLISCKNGSKFTTYVTASRCLHLLICQSGTMVSHQLLYAAGWENHGKIVTPNTLYQTISKLRKQLQDAGLTEEIIQTHPRRGWCLSETVLIEEKVMSAVVHLTRKSEHQQGLKDFCRKIFNAYPKKMLTTITRFR